jgi:CRP-like cAMP-binding protein
LAASSLFASFNREALVDVLASTEVRSYDAGDIIVTEGESGSSLFLIVSGVVKVFTRTDDGANLPLAELGLGDFFGEVSLLTGKPRTATITAHTDVTAIELDRTDFDAIVEKHPDVRTTLEDFYTLRAEKTVEAVIRRLRDRSGAGTGPQDDG